MFSLQSHPSVRVKGTENNYDPVQCLETGCQYSSSPHMHCPFCVKTEYYQDPVILKAHYRVKHVDKGIEFAGEEEWEELFKKMKEGYESSVRMLDSCRQEGAENKEDVK